MFGGSETSLRARLTVDLLLMIADTSDMRQQPMASLRETKATEHPQGLNPRAPRLKLIWMVGCRKPPTPAANSDFEANKERIASLFIEKVVSRRRFYTMPEIRAEALKVAVDA